MTGLCDRLPPVAACFAAAALLAASAATASAWPFERDAGPSVVKIFVTQQRGDYQMPWQGGPMGNSSGSGFVISKRRILTNAHLVSDARLIQVKREDDARLVHARVDFVGHDCDLATLVVEDPDFLEGAAPVRFAHDLPRPNDEITVIGFPLGGNRISVTRGIVSRIDYNTYYHSGVDQHLVIQSDAAINPGNSGGPVMFKGAVVGVAFQGLSGADNIGYAIPLPVIRHFLDDIEDGVYNGYPELGVLFMDTRNPAMKRQLKLPDAQHGVVLYLVDPFGSAHGLLVPGDALLAVDGLPIAEDGTVRIDGNNVIFAELLERKQWNESVVVDVWRAGAPLRITIPMASPRDPFLYRNQYDTPPRYLVKGGLVFSPLSREYLRTADRVHADAAVQQLFYYSEYAKTDGLYAGRDEFVVLIRRLPHPVNTYADAFLNGIVDEVNHVRIRNLRDIKRAFLHPRDGFHVIRFAGMDDELVIDAAEATAADPAIRMSYGVSSPENLDDEAPAPDPSP